VNNLTIINNNNLIIIKLFMIMELQYNHCWPEQNADIYTHHIFLHRTYIKKYT